MRHPGIIVLTGLIVVGCGGGEKAAPTVISTAPQSAVVFEGQSPTFSVTATGAGTLKYQWSRNGVEIGGATTAIYAAPPTLLGDNGGAYSVKVTGKGGKQVSTAATLTVLSHPASVSVPFGQPATFAVANGGAGLAYQWMKNGQAIGGATASSYASPAVRYVDGGAQYSVNVTSGGNVLTSSTALLTVVPAINHLVISEVASCYYGNVDCWFELHNPTGAPIDLSGYQIRSRGADLGASMFVQVSTFGLPAILVPSEGYVVVSGNGRNSPQRGVQQVLVRNGNQVPYWGADGFVEVVTNGGTTVDFVRFGASTQVPLTTTQWIGSSLGALPSSPTNYGISFVRAYPRTTDTDTDTTADWTQVNWSTPAGRNDVDALAVDGDNDGIPDSAEVPGGTFAGLDLYAIGARTGTRDIFIEVDQMASADAGVIVRPEAMQMVVDTFAARSIALHIDVGTAFAGSPSAAAFDLGQGNSVVPYEACVFLEQTTCSANISTRRSLYDWKDDNMDLRRRAVFHYALFGNSQKADGTAGSSGISETPGNDFVISMGTWGFTTTPGAPLNLLINSQAATFMHEFGHNLGLRHGGFENINYKPNYWSVMNYTYQLNGLDADASSATAYLRWKREKGTSGNPSICSLVNSPCGASSQFLMDFSNGTGSDLDEAALLESANIGRGSSGGAYADWDLDTALTATAVARDLNVDGANGVLKDYNDWANVVLPFARGPGFNSGRSNAVIPDQPLIDVVTDDRQPPAEEFAPSPAFFEELQRIR
jgi:hypothetical protein